VHAALSLNIATPTLCEVGPEATGLNSETHKNKVNMCPNFNQHDETLGTNSKFNSLFACHLAINHIDPRAHPIESAQKTKTPLLQTVLLHFTQ
jgi:hypothetical protein